MLQGFVFDIRSAGRALRTAPAAAILTTLSVALAVGSATAIFSVANALLFRPLPVTRPDELVTVTTATALHFGFKGGGGWSYAMWNSLRDREDVFGGAFAWTLQRIDLAAAGETQPAQALIASGDLFKTLGVAPMMGRVFNPTDDVRGGGPDGPVVVISYDYWQRRFGGAPAVVGTRLPIRGVPFTIVGVTPREFHGIDVGQAFDIALPFGAEPLALGARSIVNQQSALLLSVMLRLTRDQSLPAATAALRALQPQIVSAMHDPPPFLKEPFVLVDARTGLADSLRQKYEAPLTAIAAISWLVLALVGINLANLMLARTARRTREMAIRAAMGASGARLARQVVLESAMLAGIGAVLGFVLATWAGRVIVGLVPAASGTVELDLSTDWRVLACFSGATLVTLALFGLTPALRAARVAPLSLMRSESPGPPGRRFGALSGGLIAVQVALSLILVVAAIVFGQTLNRLTAVPLGFDADHVLVATIGAGEDASGTPKSRALLDARLIDAVAAVPGVADAAGSVWTPIGNGGGLITDARGRGADALRQVAYNFVTPRWFDVYRIPRQSGRDIDARDQPDTPRVAIVNESAARRLFPGRSPVGSTVDAGPCHGCLVVGVVADAFYGRSLRDAPPPTIYLPLTQSAGATPLGPTLRISARATMDSSQVGAGILQALSAVDRTVTVSLRPVRADVDQMVAQERITAMLASFFGLVALLLSALGLYGVTSYTVARRRSEIALRVALGANPRAAARLVLRHVLLVVAIGLGLGVAASIGLSRLVTSLLYGVDPRSPIVLASSAALFAIVALAAAWAPARRASRLDPAVVLREV